jgi:cell division transport system permease protein
MAQFGKSSSKRGKPSYTYAIIGMSVILFLFGIVGWIFLNVRKTGEIVKEKLQLHAWISPTAGKKQIDSLLKYVTAMPYAKNTEYVTKEKAIQKWNAENDTLWKNFIENNPLPESIDFYVKASHVNKDSLEKINSLITGNFPDVMSELQYPKDAVSAVNSPNIKYAIAIIIGFIALLAIMVIISIDNTIRLAMYSNRFLIKTMQMVGATRGFIARPLDTRAIINGLIASGIALALIFGVIFLVESYLPDFKILRDGASMWMIICGVLFLGVIMSLFSTHRAVLKYLKMKLDDLY